MAQDEYDERAEIAAYLAGLTPKERENLETEHRKYQGEMLRAVAAFTGVQSAKEHFADRWGWSDTKVAQALGTYASEIKAD
jgi:hypothetical protein